MLGPWTTTETLARHSPYAIVATTDPNWVLKTRAAAATPWKELEFFKRVGECRIRNMVHIPPGPEGQTGRQGETEWYAMRRYSTTAQSAQGRRDWRTMAIAVLNFLEDLHRGPQLLHMDIKPENILLDEPTEEWVVADYDLFDTLWLKTPAREFDDDYFWYYMAIGGAEPDEPLLTWRTDLLMLGYALAELTWDVDRFGKWEFYPECNARRTGRKGILGHMSAEELARVRTTELLFAEPTVRKYLDAVAELVPWDQVEPPAASVYEHLRGLLTAPPGSPKVSALGPQS